MYAWGGDDVRFFSLHVNIGIYTSMHIYTGRFSFGFTTVCCTISRNFPYTVYRLLCILRFRHLGYWRVGYPSVCIDTELIRNNCLKLQGYFDI